MKNNTKAKTLILLVIAGLFLMHDKLQEWFAPFQYFDEAFGLLIVPAALIRWKQKRLHPIADRNDLLFYIGLLVFFLMGWAAFFVYRYQPLTNALKDCYSNFKFFLAVGASYLIFDDPELDFGKMKCKIWPVLQVVTFVIFGLCVVDLLFGIFPADSRGPFRAVKLFYSVQSVLVATCTFLCCIYLWFYEEKKMKILLPLVLLCVVMFCTLRVKSMGAIAAVLMINLFVLKKLKFFNFKAKTKILLIAFLVFAAISILYQVFFYYVSMGTGSARAMLTLAAPFVAWDHLPTGSGWATFGSAFSAEPYSPVYGMYRMAGIWGISPNYSAFVSDTYWPMVLAETGFIGFGGLVLALVMFVKKVCRVKHAPALASGLMVLAYLLISSTSESALANPVAVPLAFWMGVLLAEQHNSSERGTAA